MASNLDFLNLNKTSDDFYNLFQNEKILFSCNTNIIEDKNQINLSICITLENFILFKEKNEIFKSEIKKITKIVFNLKKEIICIFFGENIKINISSSNFNKFLISTLYKWNNRILWNIISKKIIKEIKINNLLEMFEDNNQDFKNLHSTNDSSVDDINESINDFQIKKIIGFGGFGQVVLANKLFTNKKFGIKILNKIEIIKNKQIKNVLNEKIILEKSKNNFIVNLNFFFNSFSKIYFVMDFFENGNLLNLWKIKKSINEDKLKFYIASIALGLNYLHKKNIVHRDWKLENILIDKKGYIKLSDFGISKYLSKRQKAYELFGTPQYIAPEMIKYEGYNFEIDYWSLGIISYELINGSLPFFDKEITKIYLKILKINPKFNENINISTECKDFILGLLNKDPKKRIGSKKGIKEIIDHEFFRGFDWISLKNKKMKAPFVSNIKQKYNFGKYEEVESNNMSFDEVSLLRKYKYIL